MTGSVVDRWLGVLIYCGVMFPMLGFFNIYYALYAQVSDHFQYHASVAILALAAAGVLAAAIGDTFRPIRHDARRYAAAVGIWLLVLAAISFRQTFIYHDLDRSIAIRLPRTRKERSRTRTWAYCSTIAATRMRPSGLQAKY